MEKRTRAEATDEVGVGTDKIRKTSHFFAMRKYHNWIKSQLLNAYCKGAKRLLDLSSGKGGDLDKWISNNLEYVEGYDIDVSSVQEAERRKQEKVITGRLGNLDVNFFVLDLANNIIQRDVQRTKEFDVVTSMFAFHYMFESEQSLNTILSSIDNNLKMGGYFIGCLFDNVNLQKLLHSDFKSEHFTVKKMDASCNSFYGNKLEVSINETVLDKSTIEYIVNFQQLVGLMFVKGYRLIESETFDRSYSTWAESTNSYMKEDEKALSFLNRYFVFQRCN